MKGREKDGESSWKEKRKKKKCSTKIKSREKDKEEEEDLRNYDDTTEIIMTLEREEPIIIKRSHVKEEVIVKKETLFETKTITEELIHEHMKSSDIEPTTVKDRNTSN